MTALVRSSPTAARSTTWIPLGLAIGLGLLVVTLARWGPDWPAQEFRAWLGGQNGWALYTTRWYSGDSVLGYSVLYPPIAGAVGAGAVGVFGCGLTTWAACRLVHRSTRERQAAFGIAVALSTVVNLLIGQVPFLLGAAFAVVAFWLTLERRLAPVACLAAALASLASPLSGAFLLLTVPAVSQTVGWRRSATLVPAVVGSVVAACVGGAGGWFPCPWQTFAGVATFCVLTAWYAPRSNRAWRVFALTYLLAAIVLFIVPNPIGGNIARLGKLLALPLAVYLTTWPPNSGRRYVSVLVATAALVWPGQGLASSVARGANDPSADADFYRGVDRYLRQHSVSGERLEIPFTREHWEAFYLARHFPIARGWDRQSDLEFNAVLYRPLTAKRYRTWLDENAVGLVALPAAPIDFGGRAEAALLRHPPSYLEPVWRDAHWQIWRVDHPTPLLSGPAVISDEDPTSLRLTFTRPGSALLRFRSNQLWQANSPRFCVTGTASGWTRIVARTSGSVDLKVGLSARGVLPGDGSFGPGCVGGDRGAPKP